ncbi:MAG: hypothetical protein ABI680_16795 [Chthoniobacteraceae bacterium]
MTVDELKDIFHRRPFIPFRIHHPGGPPVEVVHPDFMMFSPTGRIAAVYLPDERQVRFDVALITALEELETRAEPTERDEE